MTNHREKDTSLEKLSQLPTVFGKDGTITAGNAPGVNDGAGALVLMSEERAKREISSRSPLLGGMPQWRVKQRITQKRQVW